MEYSSPWRTDICLPHTDTCVCLWRTHCALQADNNCGIILQKLLTMRYKCGII
nr:MAG TPA: hypothetical protein [Caudoviricetes sp.]